MASRTRRSRNSIGRPPSWIKGHGQRTHVDPCLTLVSGDVLSLDVVLDKVRKLLAKAEDPACSPAEAEALTAKATELIAKYGVDQALLAARDPARDSVVDRMIEVPSP